jgi:membrane-bound lytic murein transglycosylase D
VKSDQYEVKVPVGTGDRLRERLRTASAGELAALNWYRVKKGESIASIARKLAVSRTDLAEANSLSVKSQVRAGQELIVPRAPATLLNARVDHPAPASGKVAAALGDGSGTDNAAEERVAVKRASAESDSDDTPGTRLTYRVKRGDTLFSIAKAFETSVETLRSLNRLHGDHISPGDRLTIQTPHGTRAAQ